MTLLTGRRSSSSVLRLLKFATKGPSSKEGMVIDSELLAQRQAEGQGKGFGTNGRDGAVTQGCKGVKPWGGKRRRELRCALQKVITSTIRPLLYSKAIEFLPICEERLTGVEGAFLKHHHVNSKSCSGTVAARFVAAGRGGEQLGRMDL